MGAAVAPAIAIGQTAVQAAGTFASISAAQKQAQAQKEAAKQQAKLDKYQLEMQQKVARISRNRLIRDVKRQTKEVNRIAGEQKHDRILAAAQEMGAVEVRALERGASVSTRQHFWQTVTYLENTDLQRIEQVRKDQVKAGQIAVKRAKKDFKLVKDATKKKLKLNEQNYDNTVDLISAQRDAAVTSSVLNLVGSGLQIAGDLYNYNQSINSLTNPR